MLKKVAFYAGIAFVTFWVAAATNGQQAPSQDDLLTQTNIGSAGRLIVGRGPALTRAPVPTTQFEVVSDEVVGSVRVIIALDRQGDCWMFTDPGGAQWVSLGLCGVSMGLEQEP